MRPEHDCDRRSLETVFPEIGAIKLNRLRPIALENLLAKLRKRTYRANRSRKKRCKNIGPSCLPF